MSILINPASLIIQWRRFNPFVTTTQTISGTASIRVHTTQTLSGTSQVVSPKVRANHSNIIGGPLLIRWNNAHIASYRTTDISGTSLIAKVQKRSLTGTSFIKHVGVQTLTGASSIKNTTLKSLTGASSISKTTTKTISGTSQILPAGYTVKNISGTSFITGPTVKNISGVSSIQNVTLKTLSGTSQISGIGPLASHPIFIELPVIKIHWKQKVKFTVQTISGTSSIVANTTPPTVPGTPVLSDGGVITWGGSTGPIGVAGYELERTACPGTSGWVLIATVTSTVYVDSPGPGCWCYRVRAFDSVGNYSAYTSAVCSTTTVTTTQMIGGVSSVKNTTTQTLSGSYAIATGSSAAGVRATQEVSQVLALPEPNARVSAAHLEAVEITTNNVRNTQVVLQVIVPYEDVLYLGRLGDDIFGY